jgi:hypothetical protein
LITKFNPFAFKVIIDKEEITSVIMIFVFYIPMDFLFLISSISICYVDLL